MIIKKTKCACGAEYIDFSNQLGKCAACDGTPLAQNIQNYLKQFTYMEDHVVLLKTLQRFLMPPTTVTIGGEPIEVKRLSCEESRSISRPEAGIPALVASGTAKAESVSFWRKWFRRT